MRYNNHKLQKQIEKTEEEFRKQIQDKEDKHDKFQEDIQKLNDIWLVQNDQKE